MSNTNELKKKMKQLKAEEPRLRNIDLANKLGISEGELLGLSIGDNVTLLRTGEGNAEMKELLLNLKDLGEIMALTRNENCVHERKGVYENVEFYEGSHNMGVAVNPDIDLRYFMAGWTYALAVEMEKPGGKTLYSFQFFDKFGVAVHKIFSTSSTDISYYHSLVEKYKAAEQIPFTTEKKDVNAPKKTYKSLEEIDVADFQKSWLELKDTHDFFGMLRKYGISRLDALKAAPHGYTTKIELNAFAKVLELAVENNVSIMCFVHSPGCVQIHSGEIKNIRVMDDWFNILDPKFNLHLKTSAIDQVWIVRKMSADGVVTSVELFDKDGELIVYFFGERKPGIPELESWRKIVAEVEKTEAVV